jgi:phosphoribosyl-AMP cyclohydrolase
MPMPTLDWTKVRSVAALATEVLPVAVQDVITGQVLMVAYVNRQAIDESIERGEAVFWSTSKDALHVKGAT